MAPWNTSPRVRPYSCSIVSGERQCIATTARRMFGAYCSRSSTIRSANTLASVSQDPVARLNGANFAEIVRVCIPGCATVGSFADSITDSCNCSRDRLGDPSHPAAGPTPDSVHPSDVPEGMVAQHECGSGGPRPRHRPRDRAGGEGRLHLVGLEEFVEHVRDGREDGPSKEVFRLRGADERCEVREGHGRREQGRLDQFRELVPKTCVPGPRRGVLLRELRHLLPIPILFVPIEQEPTVREGLEEGRIVDVLLQAERWEIEVDLDFGPQEAACIRERRGAEPGMNFLRDARAAHDGATFEDQDPEARLREVRGGDEPVVTAPDDDRVHRRHGADRNRGLDKGIVACLRPSFSAVRRTVSPRPSRAPDAVPTRPPLRSRSASRAANTARRRWRSRCTVSTAATSNRSWPNRSDDSPSTAEPSPAKARWSAAAEGPCPSRNAPPPANQSGVRPCGVRDRAAAPRGAPSSR